MTTRLCPICTLSIILFIFQRDFKVLLQWGGHPTWGFGGCCQTSIPRRPPALSSLEWWAGIWISTSKSEVMVLTRKCHWMWFECLIRLHPWHPSLNVKLRDGGLGSDKKSIEGFYVLAGQEAAGWHCWRLGVRAISAPSVATADQKWTKQFGEWMNWKPAETKPSTTSCTCSIYAGVISFQLSIK